MRAIYHEFSYFVLEFQTNYLCDVDHLEIRINMNNVSIFE